MYARLRIGRPCATVGVAARGTQAATLGTAREGVGPMTQETGDVAPTRRAIEPSDAMREAARRGLFDCLSVECLAGRFVGLTPSETIAEALAIGGVVGYAQGRDDALGIPRSGAAAGVLRQDRGARERRTAR